MNDTNHYPNYIGVETSLLQSLRVKIKYTGDAVKDVVVCEGNLVSIAHVVNRNGQLTQEMSLGIVKEVGCDAVARTFTPNQYALNPEVANPNYIVIDKSNTYKSDIVTIYVRDIRNIIVGPMADGNFAKGQISGDTLPYVTESNLDFYLGKFFYLTKTDEVNTIEKGLYYYKEDGWLPITDGVDKTTSPLAGFFKKWTDGNPKWVLQTDVVVPGHQVDDSLSPVPALNVIAVGEPFVKTSVVGSIVTYQIQAELETELPTASSEEEYNTIHIASNSGRIIPTKDTPINVNRINIDGKWYDIYHNVNTYGDIILCYPNKPGIKELNLFGLYMI